MNVENDLVEASEKFTCTRDTMGDSFHQMMLRHTSKSSNECRHPLIVFTLMYFDLVSDAHNSQLHGNLAVVSCQCLAEY